jgi:nitrite reductase/ring-hydroxylating ferredoxin subunit
VIVLEVRVCSFDDVRRLGRLIYTYGGKAIVLFYYDGKVYAFDNRCPHMGFPLSRGSIANGILTCEWHHARFDLESGCSFDVWADDARVYRVRVVDGDVYVEIPDLDVEDRARILRRLRKGLEHGVQLIIAKALVSAIYSGLDVDEIYRASISWAMERNIAWGGGSTFIVSTRNIQGYLDNEGLITSLLRGLSILSGEASDRAQRPVLDTLAGSSTSLPRLKSWLRHFAEVRDSFGIEVILASMAFHGYGIRDIAEVFFSVATDHYLSDGHVVDFANKAFQYLETILGRPDPNVLRSLAPLLAEGRRYKESHEWRHPVDLVEIVDEESGRLAEVFRAGGDPIDPGEVAGLVINGDPRSIAKGITGFLEKGFDPRDVALGVALAGAQRIAMLSSSNEIGDWLTVLHTFSYANAIYQVVKRVASHEVFRGVYHGALKIYLDRFLNIPPFKIPNGSPGESKEKLLKSLVDLLNRRYMIDDVAYVVADYIANGYEDEDLLRTICRSVAREDADFHTMQMLDAGISIYRDLRSYAHRKIVLIAIARYTASQAPTDRRTSQVANIALKLHTGQSLHSD